MSDNAAIVLLILGVWLGVPMWTMASQSRRAADALCDLRDLAKRGRP
ncbi:hypothetical protein [Sphingomonas crocodyli]|nr:hypothetical protein [Sphingomonas crocodyli]